MKTEGIEINRKELSTRAQAPRKRYSLFESLLHPHPGNVQVLCVSPTNFTLQLRQPIPNESCQIQMNASSSAPPYGSSSDSYSNSSESDIACEQTE